MGRRKIPMKLIENKGSRNTTFKKRKAGLIKKAMELNILTGAHVRLVIYDKKRMYEYGSEDRHEPLLSLYTGKNDIPRESFSNRDYESLESLSSTSELDIEHELNTNLSNINSPEYSEGEKELEMECKMRNSVSPQLMDLMKTRQRGALFPINTSLLSLLNAKPPNNPLLMPQTLNNLISSMTLPSMPFLDTNMIGKSPSTPPCLFNNQIENILSDSTQKTPVKYEKKLKQPFQFFSN